MEMGNSEGINRTTAYNMISTFFGTGDRLFDNTDFYPCHGYGTVWDVFCD